MLARETERAFSGGSGLGYPVKPVAQLPGAMPLTEEEKLALGASDLKFLLTTCEIKTASQATLFEAGVNTLANFAAFVTTETDLKDQPRSGSFSG